MALALAMKLYAIQRKSDGKFFIAAHGHHSIYTGRPEYQFAVSPSQFLKTPDGVAGNLRKLCSEPYPDTEPPKGVCAGVASRWKELAWRNFDPAKLDLYDVIVTHVALFSTEKTSADKFIQADKIASAPLRSKERV